MPTVYIGQIQYEQKAQFAGGVGKMRILLSNSSPEPIYEQIVRQVRAQIISGELPEGALLPSIRALAHDLQISVITTRTVVPIAGT